MIAHLKYPAVLSILCLAFFVFLEGVGSIAVSLARFADRPKPSAPSVYDSTLGWKSPPNTYLPDYYGPGKYIKTNSLGFRNDEDTTSEAPVGKLRIICSGDSFTYGQGVANDHTWCDLLTELDDRVTTVNLGQPGYGIDQIYLRYLEDGLGLQHDIHIFAFVDGDLARMGRYEQSLYGKPVLILDNDEIVVRNTPVPRLRWRLSRWLQVADFRSVHVLRRLFARLSDGSDAAQDPIATVGPVALQVFDRIKYLGKRDGVLPILLFLPAETNLGENTPWHEWLQSKANGIDTQFIDLTADLRLLPAGQVATFFIPQSLPGSGHYTEAGNRWVAESLYERISRIPAVTKALADTERQR